jgi:aryl-alcohol dehydrogenase-like predicted oxidoreductase
MPWVLNAEEGVKHIKAAYDAGIQTFDTANVHTISYVSCDVLIDATDIL